MARGWGVPGYTEVRTLGTGGFGDVVLARQDASSILVAIKYLHRALLDDPEFVELFRAEARVLASLDDPNVVRLYEYVESPSGAAIVMELVDGVSLRDMLVRYGSTSPESALVVLQGSLLGLAAAHARGVVHRDYKPENVLVDGAGMSKLTDFGIAARSGDRPVPAGSLKYAPPEQFAGDAASPAGDVYAATATFYECLTGRPPFTGSTTESLLDQHMSAPVPLEPVPEPLRALVAAGMAKDPRYRPSDAASLVTRLREIAGPAYGQDWEDRGRSHLREAALLLLAALWPSGTAGAEGHAAQGHAVEQAHLSRNTQVPQNTQVRAEHINQLGRPAHSAHNVTGAQSTGAANTTSATGTTGAGANTPATATGAGGVTAGPASATRSQRLIRSARESRRVPRWLRNTLPNSPSAGVATTMIAGTALAGIAAAAAIGVVAAAATAPSSAPQSSLVRSASTPGSAGSGTPSGSASSVGPGTPTSPAPRTSPASVLAGPGSNCGNNGLTWGGGAEVVVVVSGRISCSDAIKTFNQYGAVLQTKTQEETGSGGFVSFDGWSCSHASVAEIQSNGIDAECVRSGIQLETKRD